MGKRTLLLPKAVFLHLTTFFFLLGYLNAYLPPCSERPSNVPATISPALQPSQHRARRGSIYKDRLETKPRKPFLASFSSRTTCSALGRTASPRFCAFNGASKRSSNPQSYFYLLRKFASKHFFLMGMLVAVGSARAFPLLGVDGGILRPELLIGKWGVSLIFLVSGLSLEVSQLARALSNVKLNAAVQLASFGAWPLLVGWPLRRALSMCAPGLYPPELLDGLLVLTTLPTTVNMCVILTGSAGGDVAAALCNAVLGNVAGVFVTPALLLCFLGKDIQLPLLSMLSKLSTKVLLPVLVGQVLRLTPIRRSCERHSKTLKRLQEVVLLSILWNAFCTAISNNLGLGLRHGLALAVLLPAVHFAALGSLFAAFSLPVFRLSRPQVVAASLCASQKTLAFGLPLVHTVFAGSPNLAWYSAPIMFVHPIQLLLGSLLVPYLESYVQDGGCDYSAPQAERA